MTGAYMRHVPLPVESQYRGAGRRENRKKAHPCSVVTRFRAILSLVIVLWWLMAFAIASTPADPRLLSGRSRIVTIVLARSPAADRATAAERAKDGRDGAGVHRIPTGGDMQ